MKKIITNWKLALFSIALISSIILIHPNIGVKGVVIVGTKSPAPSGLENLILTHVNGESVNNVTQFKQVTENLDNGTIITLTLKKEGAPYTYKEVETRPYQISEKGELGLIVKNVPPVNLQFGLEISGGTKLLLKPGQEISQTEFENVVNILRQRLDLFGIKGAQVTSVKDLTGDKFIEVNLAGVSQEEAVKLLEKEGKFEAKINNETVFTGADIKDVCISGSQCVMRIQPVKSDNGFVWRFEFGLVITQEAANKFAQTTSKLGETCQTPTQCYLNATIDFYLDNELIQDASLNIPSTLRGKAITNPVITGAAPTQKEAQQEMKYLQSILQSRKLPVKLNIVSSETISPVQGREFAENVFIIFIISIILVDVLIALRYKDHRIVFITIFVSLAEIMMTLGVASGIKWSLDVASIAGIIASVGTGIDDQIVILEEVMQRKKRSLNEKIKRAFFIVVAAYFVSVASMIPLWFAGAGLIRGFAVTTIIGITIGVFITRPAFAELIKLYKKE